MADAVINSQVGPALNQLLNADQIEPGHEPSYQLAKIIYLFHPLGAKIAESPVRMAQHMPRVIAVTRSPGERVADEFKAKWKEIKATQQIFNVAKLARVYGISTLAMRVKGVDPDQMVDPFDLPGKELAFVVFDPLNTAGSLVLNQNPRDFDFQQIKEISVGNEIYHRTRVCVLMNEEPVYISYTSSAFGYTGRSAYQRAIFPLKSFVQSMLTDDMVVQKAGLLIACIKQAGSIIDNVMAFAGGIKRAMLKGGKTGQVLQIHPDERIETLNMMNLDGAFGMARKDILENIAVAADMPAKLLNSETFAEGFGEGTEDAKHVAGYIDGIREWLDPAYEFMTDIVMYLAWTPEFFASIKADFPEYKGKSYKTVFMEWKNSFTAEWPDLLKEPESEQVKTEDVKAKSMVSVFECIVGLLDPDNKATAVQWLADNINKNKLMFSSPLILDYEALANYVPPLPGGEDGGEDDNGGTDTTRPKPKGV